MGLAMASVELRGSEGRETSLRLSIGGICVSVASRDPELTPVARGASRDFAVSSGRADASVLAQWADLREPATGDPIFDSNGLWRLYRQSGQYVFRFASPAYGPLPYKEARFTSDFTSGRVSLHRAYFEGRRSSNPLEYPLDEIWLVNLLAQGRGVEVHACGVRDSDGRGYLFLAHSGGGKTTMARLWESEPGVQVLSDDRIVLRFLDGRLWMYGTPWHGDANLAAPLRTGLDRIFFLGRGRNQIVPIGRPDAVSRLLARSFVPFFYNAPALDFTLGLLQRISDAVPCAALNFVPDRFAVDLVREWQRDFS
jgi:hypothetical protein